MSGNERKNDAVDAAEEVTISDGEGEILEETLPPMEDASVEQKRIEVLGYNHRRRTEAERQEDEARRRTRRMAPSRWQKRVRWRLRSDRKLRWFCICFTCLITGVVSMVSLWSLGELVAALAVTGTIMLLGIGACLAAEIVVRCPNAVEWLLYDMGFITPYAPLNAGDDYEAMYDLEIGGDRSMSFGSPDVPLDVEADDFDEMGKPLYGAHAVRENRPMEKAKRAASTVLRTFQSAWAPAPADDGYDYGNDSDYEVELGQLAEDLQLRDTDAGAPDPPPTDGGPDRPIGDENDEGPSGDIMKTG